MMIYVERKICRFDFMLAFVLQSEVCRWQLAVDPEDLVWILLTPFPLLLPRKPWKIVWKGSIVNWVQFE